MSKRERVHISKAVLFPEQISLLDDFAKGVYLLLDEKDSVLYVGQSKNLPSRIRQHFYGETNTSEFRYLFKKFSVFLIDDDKIRGNLESFLIRNFKPPINIQFLEKKEIATK